LVNFVPPLWFTVAAVYHLTDSNIGLIGALLGLTTNFGQPLFGYIVDRYRLRNVIPFALAIATVFMCTLGFAPRLWVFVAFMMLAGCGVALFHPRGGSLAAEASGSRRAFGMSIFGAGGLIGYAAASLVAPLLDSLGLRVGMKPLQGLIFALPLGLLAVFLLWRFQQQREKQSLPEETPEYSGMPPLETFSLRRHLLPHLGPLTPLFIVMVLRSTTAVSFATYIQVLQGRLGHSSLFQGTVLFFFVGGAAIGSLLGSHLSDRCGRRCITVISLLLSPPLLYYSLHASPAMVIVLLLLGGATLRAAESINIAQTQDLLPHGMSTASAISMGFTWGVAGLLVPLVGLLSERTESLAIALSATCVLPIIAALVALSLPSSAPKAGNERLDAS
jgi:FSR family fosmidomycin resistance protein-like MFS transporter